MPTTKPPSPLDSDGRFATIPTIRGPNGPFGTLLGKVAPVTRNSFDLVVRRLAAAPSRRNLLHLLVAIVLGRTFATNAPSPTVAAPKRKPRPVPCQKLNRACTKRKPCCPGTKCLRGRCRCPGTAKPCGPACIPRALCCPATNDGCASIPPGCPADSTPCGQTCIARDACCTNSDCTGPCVGACVNGRCQRAARGTPCGGDGRKCNTQGMCAQTCTVDDDCPQPPDDTTPAEFCRQAICVDQFCEETHKLDYTEVPEGLQRRGDCKVLECVNTFPNGIAISSDKSDSDVPDDLSPCFKGYCLNFEPRQQPRPVGHWCNSDGSLVCNASQQCVPATP